MAQLVFDAYTQQFNELSPFANSYGAAFGRDFFANAGFSLNHGWDYATPAGKAGTLRFSLVASSTLIPSSGGYIQAGQLYQSPNTEISGAAANLYGGKSNGYARFYLLDPASGQRLVNPLNGEYIKGDFPLPDGIGTGIGLTPFLIPQLEVSAGFGTALSIRFLPVSLHVNSGKASLTAYGVGFKHQLSNYIPALAGSALHLQFFASYMHNKLTYAPANGDLLEISGNYFNSEGSSMQIAQESSAFQVLLAGNYPLSSFFTLTAQTGMSWQNSQLNSSGDLQINITTPSISENIISTAIPHLIHIRQDHSSPHIGAGLLMGSGLFKTSFQYAYAGTHLAAIGFYVQVYAP